MTALVVMMNDTPVYVVVFRSWERANEKCVELEGHYAALDQWQYGNNRPVRSIHVVEVEAEEEEG